MRIPPVCPGALGVRGALATALAAALCLCTLATPSPVQARENMRRAEAPGREGGAEPSLLTLDLSRANAVFTLPARSFGTNMPLDRPVQAWDQKGWKQSLRSAGVSVLRFPGGEVSDGYDWRTNTLSANMVWSEQRGDAESEKMDFRGMLKLAKQMGAADLFFVVNLEGGLTAKRPLREQLERKAEEAAQWVAAVKAEGGFVPYWEIGNESYLSGTTYPLTAQEYAQAVSLFARKMKAVDPNIRIGANGPSSWSGQGFMDQLAPQARAAFRENLGQSQRECKESKRECLEEFGAAPRRDPGEGGWWPVLARVAGADIDFAVVHAYYRAGGGRGESSSGLGMPTTRAQGFQGIGLGWRAATGKPLPLALTEWNSWPDENGPLSPHQHFLMAAESILATTAAGVQHSAFWPMRAPEAARKAFVPLLPRDGSSAPMLQLLGLFNGQFHGEVLSPSGRLSRDTLMLVVRRGTDFELAFLNVGADQRVRVEGASCTHPGAVQASVVNESGVQPGRSLNAPCREGRLDAFEIPLAPGALTWVQLTAAKAR
jgi:hypothetical protein